MLRLSDVGDAVVAALMARHGLTLQRVADGAEIPGSYWGDCEAGLQGSTLYGRGDTPIHSLLHEGCHAICMGETRRAALDRDAGGDDAEECAVCYLQLVLADEIPGFGFDRACRDMDAWGYSFRLGSARAWFETDASDARQWLAVRGFLPVIAGG